MPASSDQELIEAARRGDESAYQELVEQHRAELHAHCYRMLGSVHDAEDALQDAFLRAWKGLRGFQGRSSPRSWLYKIATNTCLDTIARRPRQRVLPFERGPATEPLAGPGAPITESVWIEPYPDEMLGLPDGLASPEARYERRESVELAFVAALQHLPARQRAVLILREVLGYSAAEVAGLLDTTVASVNSAMQRARAAVDERLPDPSQQETLRALGDRRISVLVDRYLAAWENNDVDTVVAMLTEDAAIAMPPLANWFGPRDVMATFLAAFPMSGDWRWKAVRTTANAQPALGFYAWDDAAGAYLAFALNVLSFRGDKVKDVTAFMVRTTDLERDEQFHRWVDYPADRERLELVFGRFGLPDALPA
jgi:RNA polymerase sigma-70 factor (ECF subfamily)